MYVACVLRREYILSSIAIASICGRTDHPLSPKLENPRKYRGRTKGGRGGSVTHGGKMEGGREGRRCAQRCPANPGQEFGSFLHIHDTIRNTTLGIENTDREGYVSANLDLFISDIFEKRAEVETHGVGTSTDWAG